MSPLSPSRLRTINLIETLSEEKTERGEEKHEAPEEAVEWPEDRIRAWFSARDDKEKNLKKKKKESEGTTEASSTTSPAPFRPPPPPPPPPPPSINPALRSLWFPSAARLDPPPSSSPPACVLVAFSCAGSAEDLWTSEGSGPRRARSPLLRWLSAKGGRMLAVQLPGRAARRRERFAESAAAVAKEVVALVAAEILVPEEKEVGGEEEKKKGGFGRVPWFVAGHSMGAWLAFELASAARDAGLPPPRRLLLSAMPPPHTPEAERPWRGPAAGLPTPALIEECRAWGISEAVFSPGVWEEYESLLRNDFRLFDEYRFERQADPPFQCPLTFFYGDRDTRVPLEVAKGWERYCEGEGEVEEEQESAAAAASTSTSSAVVVVVRKTRNFELVRVRDGRHLWPLDKQHKREWLWEIAKRMASDLGLPGPEDDGGEVKS